MKKLSLVIGLMMVAVLAMGASECETQREPVSSTGVHKATTTIETGADGLTVEQRNVKERLEMDNTPGSIKHLYVISAYSGQTLIYSTVKGKVTSSGKRLTPTTVAANAGEWDDGIPVNIGGNNYHTSEVLQDDGTYGSSDPYIYWFDVKGVYHQHYLSGGQIIHVSDQPLAVKSVIINMELVGNADIPTEAPKPPVEQQ
jgi:hypothetical protein